MRVPDCERIMGKVMRSYGEYGEELRQINYASTTRPGKNSKGYPPKGFEQMFSYAQPRRNNLGAGDLTVRNTNTGEMRIYRADEVSKAFSHTRAPKHSQYNLKYDKRNKVDPT